MSGTVKINGVNLTRLKLGIVQKTMGNVTWNQEKLTILKRMNNSTVQNTNEHTLIRIIMNKIATRTENGTRSN